MKYLSLLCFLSCSLFAFSQSTNPVIQAAINQTDLNLLKKVMDEFTGEVSATVGGQQVSIKNRVSASAAGNNLAADYIKEKFTSYGLTPVIQNYSSGGRNVYAVQTGKVNPNNIHIICGHYDAVANYCADDNATGSITVLEAARILSKYSFENTIIYALWDEEETGLKGSAFYAKEAVTNQLGIKSVLNIDMNGYDSNSDDHCDVDYRNVAQSAAMKNLMVGLIPSYNLNLVLHPVVSVNDDSDHASFLNRGFTCIFLGECWDKNDVTPYYHSSNDRASTLNWPYYHKLVKLAIAYIGTVAVPLATDIADNTYSLKDKISVYPNPVRDNFTIELENISTTVKVDITDITGKVIYSETTPNTQTIPVYFSATPGVYFVSVSTDEGRAVHKLIKQE